MSSWLTAMDDYLTARWTRCLWCGSPGVIMELRDAGDFAMTYALCRTCFDSDPSGAKRQDLVEQRRQEGSSPA